MDTLGEYCLGKPKSRSLQSYFKGQSLLEDRWMDRQKDVCTARWILDTWLCAELCRLAKLGNVIHKKEVYKGTKNKLMYMLNRNVK